MIVTYEIVHTAHGWALLCDGEEAGVLDTRMAAFDSAYAAAVTAMLSGHGVTLKVAHEVEN